MATTKHSFDYNSRWDQKAKYITLFHEHNPSDPSTYSWNFCSRTQQEESACFIAGNNNLVSWDPGSVHFNSGCSVEIYFAIYISDLWQIDLLTSFQFSTIWASHWKRGKWKLITQTIHEKMFENFACRWWIEFDQH